MKRNRPDPKALEAALANAGARRVAMGLPETPPENVEYEAMKAERRKRKKRKVK